MYLTNIHKFFMVFVGHLVLVWIQSKASFDYIFLCLKNFIKNHGHI